MTTQRPIKLFELKPVRSVSPVFIGPIDLLTLRALQPNFISYLFLRHDQLSQPLRTRNSYHIALFSDKPSNLLTNLCFPSIFRYASCKFLCCLGKTANPFCKLFCGHDIFVKRPAKPILINRNGEDVIFF